MINVLCVDDNQDLATVIELCITGQSDMRCVGVRHSADNLPDAVTSLDAHVVLLDLTMPGKDPLEALQELAETAPSTRVIVFSGHDDPALVDRVIDAGGWGFLSKHGEIEDALQAIRDVAAGHTVLPGLPR